MNIELKEITIRELTDGYKDNAEEGVVGYGGKLDILTHRQPPLFGFEKKLYLCIL